MKMKKAGKAVSVLMAAVLAAGVSAPAAFAAAPHVQSDTTMDFTVDKGNTYAFKFTEIGSHIDPHIAAGNGAVLRTESVRHVKESGNDVYYFKVRTIGNCGQESAVYTTLPGQSAVRHCKIKVGVATHKDAYYYSKGMLSFSTIRQQLIDYMSYNGYTHSASLDNASINTTPTAQGILSNDIADKQYQAVVNGQTTEATKTSFIEAEIKKSADDLVAELKKHKTTQYGTTLETTSGHDNDALIPTFKSNLTYTTNPAPEFTSKYYQNGYSGVMQATANGGNLGCNDYIFGRAKEITGQTISGSISGLLPKGLTTADINKIKADGYTIGTEPKKDAIAIEPDVGSYLGHFEYVEVVNGDDITLSGANKNDDYKYYGTVTRTKQDLKDWNTVYVYLK